MNARARRARPCSCYYCSARREAAAGLYRGPSRFRARLGHLRYLVREWLAS